MNSLVLIALLGPCAQALPEPRIVGGSDTSISEVPYIVSVQVDGSHNCGGSILTDRVVVTAAHCIHSQSESSMSIRAGSSTHNKDGQVVQVKSMEKHSKYEYPVHDYDVAVLKLENPLKFGSDVANISLASAGQSWPTGTKCLISGWGRTSTDGSIPESLQSVDVELYSQSDCKSIYRSIVTPRMFCAGGQDGGKGSCNADSGGPLVIDEVLAGIVTGGSQCGMAEYPTIYANVSSPEILDFINGQLKE